MKKICLLLAISAFSLCSCSNKDTFVRYAYLSAKYELTGAAFSKQASIGVQPAHFSDFKKMSIDFTECKNLFDLKKSYFTYRVEIVNGQGHGYGSLDLSFTDTSISPKHYEFDYAVLYDKSYGGKISFFNDTKPDIVNTQACRRAGPGSWVRADFNIPEIENGKRIIAEFTYSEGYEEPAEFK